MLPGVVGIVFCPPDIMAGTVLFPDQLPCFPRAERSIRPSHTPMGFDGCLFPLKMFQFKESHLAAPYSISEPSLLSCFPPGEETSEAYPNRSKNQPAHQDSRQYLNHFGYLLFPVLCIRKSKGCANPMESGEIGDEVF
jgi:hypothetical protein